MDEKLEITLFKIIVCTVICIGLAIVQSFSFAIMLKFDEKAKYSKLAMSLLFLFYLSILAWVGYDAI